MPKAGEFLKTEQGKAQETLSPRDFLNKQYIYRFEDVVETLDISARFDRFAFLNALNKLYWSFIVPRKYDLNEDLQDQITKLAKCFTDKKEADGFILFEKIAKILHVKGFVRTERSTADPNHAETEEKEVV